MNEVVYGLEYVSTYILGSAWSNKLFEDHHNELDQVHDTLKFTGFMLSVENSFFACCKAH